MVYEKIVWNDFSRKPSWMKVSIRDDTNKMLNQDIAFRANAEDNCKGHFFESRFKSQALLDEQALSF